MDILRIEAPQRRIETFGVAICYAIVGINSEGDIILGHYVPSVSQETALQLAKHLINGQNSISGKRQLNYSNFEFNFIPGPVHGFCDVSYDRGEGLVVTTRKLEGFYWKPLKADEKYLEVINNLSKNYPKN